MQSSNFQEYLDYRLQDQDKVKEEIKEFGLLNWLLAFLTVASW